MVITPFNIVISTFNIVIVGSIGVNFDHLAARLRLFQRKKVREIQKVSAIHFSLLVKTICVSERSSKFWELRGDPIDPCFIVAPLIMFPVLVQPGLEQKSVDDFVPQALSLINAEVFYIRVFLWL
jgi:hypothetical protein